MILSLTPPQKNKNPNKFLVPLQMTVLLHQLQNNYNLSCHILLVSFASWTSKYL